jgi:hypothetical protein
MFSLIFLDLRVGKLQRIKKRENQPLDQEKGEKT